MTLRELSYEYKEHADALARAHPAALRQWARETEDAGAARRGWSGAWPSCGPLLQEARELAVLTRHYYDRRYHRNGKYTL